MRKMAILGGSAIIVVVVVVYLAFFSYSSEPPVLKNLGVDFAPWDPATGRAGAFIFSNEAGIESKVFLEFGAVVGGPEGEKVLPTFEYYVDPNADVYAVCDGVVIYVNFQEETQDYEVGIAPQQGFNLFGFVDWYVDQDHILNPTVSVWDKVVAGQVIGKPGTHSENVGRTEIMIVRGSTAYAPFKFFDPALSEEYQQKVWRLMSDWENFMNDPTLYDQESMKYAGCLYENLPA